MMLIDKKTYAVKEHNRHKVKSAKTQIVIATSLRKNNYHITRLLHKDFGNTKNWSTYSINRNGGIFQHFDAKFHGNFLGIKEADKKSISIVLENMGCLFKTPSGKYINWLNEECNEENVINKKWLGYNYWEKFPKEQVEGLILLCREMCEKYNIPKVCIDFHHYHKDTLKFRGIVFRSNYIEDSSDINPLFNISEFNEMLRNEFI